MTPLGDYLAITGVTTLASFHCAGMCGGFAAALAGRSKGVWTNAGAQMVYSAGRLTTYICLGGLAGLAGGVLSGGGSMLWVARGLSFAAGVALLGLGLHHAGLLLRFRLHFFSKPPAFLAKAMRATVALGDSVAPYALGVLTGFLPCGLVAAWLIKAAESGSALEGVLTMAFFGLGTVPTMVAVGMAPKAMPVSWRAPLAKAGGWLMIVFAVVCLARALPWELMREAPAESRGEPVACPLCH